MPITVEDTIQDLNGTITRRTPRVKSDDEIERDAVLDRLQQALPFLAAWSQDAKTAPEITAMTAGERIARQAVIEQRVAALAQALRALIKKATDL